MSPKNDSIPIRTLDQELIDNLYKQLSSDLTDLIKELNNSSNIGAFGAMATLSGKISEMASDIKKLQHLPAMLTNPFILENPREILDEIAKKYTKKKKNNIKK